MVTTATTTANRNAAYHVLQKHAEIIAKKEYAQQLAVHLKKGRKKSTFRYSPSDLLNKLVRMSKDVVGTRNTHTGKVTYKTTPKEVMGFIANDGEFNYVRYGGK